MNSEDIAIISIIGRQNAGKTTLIREIIPRLKERGYRVGTIKYNIPEFEIDHEGKDTYKYFHSGADTVAISSRDKVAVIKKVENSPQLSEIIGGYFNDVSVILVEGYREGGHPMIKIMEPQIMDIDRKGSEKELLLVKENLKTRRFSEKDIDRALDFIEDIISNKNKTLVQKNA